MKLAKFNPLSCSSFFLSLIIVVMICSLSSCSVLGGHPKPTAIVIDADTEEPIEGAVAIAIWRKHSTKEAAWFEGGKMVPVRIEEVLSDAQGRIYIDVFWGWYLFENRYPRLTIYKQGYICWDQKLIHIPGHSSEQREDFDKKNRIARLKKWPENFSFVRHSHFVSSVTGFGDVHDASQQKFLKAFNYETTFFVDEMTKINKSRK